MSKKKNLYVFTNGYGLVRFRIEKVHNAGKDTETYKGSIRLPKGITSTEGKKWLKYYYRFKLGEVFAGKKDAKRSL